MVLAAKRDMHWVKEITCNVISFLLSKMEVSPIRIIHWSFWYDVNFSPRASLFMAWKERHISPRASLFMAWKERHTLCMNRELLDCVLWASTTTKNWCTWNAWRRCLVNLSKAWKHTIRQKENCRQISYGRNISRCISILLSFWLL